MGVKFFSCALCVGLLLMGCASTSSSIEGRKKERATGYSALPPETRTLVDSGQIRKGMNQDAVYIAWGKPAQILEEENQTGHATIWLYEGGWLEETRYWAGGRRYSHLEHDYQPREYVRAEIIFRDGKVESWRTLPKPVY
jgi:hypothetical protein